MTSSILLFNKILSLSNLFIPYHLYLYCDFHQIFSCPLLPVSLTFASVSPSCLKKLGLSNDDDGDDNVDGDDNNNGDDDDKFHIKYKDKFKDEDDYTHIHKAQIFLSRKF